MTGTQQLPRGVILVGSVPLPTVDDVMQKVSKSLGHLVRRIPDGEVGVRQNWIYFQRDILQKCPLVVRSLEEYEAKDVEPAEIIPQDLASALSSIETGYDTYAIESYARFRALREAGQIAEGVRFQVCLPTAVAVISPHVQPAYQEAVEPFYENALMKAIRRIQNTIPAEDLAIQFDLPIEIAFLEGLQTPLFLPWWSPIEEGLYERILRFINAVDKDVEVGLHFCYGDYGNKHFLEPRDTAVMVKAANTVTARSAHKIAWMHMPVPKSRDDDEYFAPLAELKLSPDTELYLGLVHPEDEAGTLKRIATAAKYASEFGVGSECGLARTPAHLLDNILDISASVCLNS